MYRMILTGVALSERFLSLALNLLHQFSQWLGGVFTSVGVVLKIVV